MSAEEQKKIWDSWSHYPHYVRSCLKTFEAVKAYEQYLKDHSAKIAQLIREAE